MWLFRFITCEELNHVMSTLGERLSRSLYFYDYHHVPAFINYNDLISFLKNWLLRFLNHYCLHKLWVTMIIWEICWRSSGFSMARKKVSLEKLEHKFKSCPYLAALLGEGLFHLIYKHIRTKNMSFPPQGWDWGDDTGSRPRWRWQSKEAFETFKSLWMLYFVLKSLG